MPGVESRAYVGTFWWRCVAEERRVLVLVVCGVRGSQLRVEVLLGPLVCSHV